MPACTEILGVTESYTLLGDDCDPVTSSSCGAAKPACYVDFDEEGRHYTECIPEGAGRQGASCEDPTDCARNFVCVGHHCQQFCRSGASDCPSGLSCMPLFPPAIIGTTEYGRCK